MYIHYAFSYFYIFLYKTCQLVNEKDENNCLEYYYTECQKNCKI